MKKSLAFVVLAVVFLNVQSFAKWETTNLVASITGIYGGVMIPKSTTDEAGNRITPSNSLALFSFLLPQTGFGTGAVLVFSEGRVYDGKLTAMGNPQTAEIRGIINASYDFSIYDPRTDASIDVTATSNGKMKAKVESSFGALVINGKASLSISQGEVDRDLNPVIVQTTEYTVSGVQQSTSSQASSGISLGTK